MTLRLWARICIVGLLLVSCLNAEALSPDAAQTRIVIKPWKEDPGAELGFGWAPAEAVGAQWRWISHMEADVVVELAGAKDLKYSMRVAPMYLKSRRQVVGLYVNGVFVDEWLCRDSTKFRTYETVIPGSLLKPGRNTFTLRAGYRKSLKPGGEELALAVERIDLGTP